MGKRAAAPAASMLLLLLLIGFAVSSCVKNKPDEETLFLYARAAGTYAEGRFAECVELLPAQTTNSFFPALVLKGKAEFFLGNEEAAEKHLRRALKLKPASAEASLYLARLLREKGETKEAAVIIETLLSANPYDLKALRFAANLEMEKGPAGEAAALSCLDRAAEASLETALIFLDRAKIRWTGGSGPGALEDLRRAEAALPEDSPLRRSVISLASIIRNSLAGGAGEKTGEKLP